MGRNQDPGGQTRRTWSWKDCVQTGRSGTSALEGAGPGRKCGAEPEPGSPTPGLDPQRQSCGADSQWAAENLVERGQTSPGRTLGRATEPAKYFASITQRIHCDLTCCCLLVNLWQTCFLRSGVIPKVPDANGTLEKKILTLKGARSGRLALTNRQE
jgi:hypothetical protein